MPKPKYASASRIASSTSSLGRGGPSPSELVGDCTTCTCQPGGASSISRRSPSSVSAQFFDLAARSTTSLCSVTASVAMYAEHVPAGHQPIGDSFELDRGPDQPQLEGAIVGVVVGVARDDGDSLRGQCFTQVGECRPRLGPQGVLHDAADASKPVLEPTEPREDERHEDARAHRFDVESRADRDTERRHHPDGGGRGEPGDHTAALHDRPRADEADARDDLRSQSSRVTDARRSVDHAYTYRHVGEQRGANADEDVRPQSRRFGLDLALEPDRATEDDGEREFREEVEAEDAVDVAQRRHVAGARDDLREQGNGHARPAPRAGTELSGVEVAHVAWPRVGRCVAETDAAGLLLELGNRGFIGLGGSGEGAEHGAAAPFASHGTGYRLVVGLFVAAGQAYQRHETARSTVVCHEFARVWYTRELCKRHAARGGGLG